MPLDSQYSRLPKQLRDAAKYRQWVIAQAIRWTRSAWSINRPQDPNAWFATYAEQYASVVEQAQYLAAEASIAVTDVALDLQNYEQEPDLHADPESFAGVTGSGMPIMGLAYAQALKVAEAVDAGAPVTELAQVWQNAGMMLAVATQTAISDASRLARLTHLEARPGTSWIRIVRPPCCARCAILAGKRGGKRMDFKRHPGCDCDAIPISEATSDTHKLWYFDSKDYFDSLNTEQQNKIFTKAGAQAIRDGADINQVVNARRGMTTAWGGFSRKRLVTTEGTTKRGWASEYLREQYGARMQKSGGRYRRSSVNRLMPEEIYRIAGDDRDLALSLLHKNGYLTDATPDLSGKWSWAARDKEVRRSQLKISGGGGGGKPPVKPPTTFAGKGDDGHDYIPWEVFEKFDLGEDGSWKERLTVEPGKHKKELHEWATFIRLAQNGHTVVVRVERKEDGIKNPDLVLDGEVAEAKTPKGAGADTIPRNVRSASKQARTIIIDLLQSDRDAVRAWEEMQAAAMRYGGNGRIEKYLLLLKDRTERWGYVEH